MPRLDWSRYIRQRAPTFGVDPQAALAVASVEGLSGRPGDQNTSFGPFQLHVGGALPPGRDRGWAESPQGIDYALRQIGGVSKGLTGRPAVENIVRRFERPADPTGEIARALSVLPSVGAPAFAAGPAAPAAPPPIPSARAAAPTFKAPNVEALTQALLAGKPIGGLLGRPAAPTGAVNADKLTNTLLAGRPIGRMLAPPPASQPGPLPLAQPRTVTQPSGGYPLATRGKVIGVPYQGTHTLYGNWESDNAVDLATPAGTPVVALADGTIGPQIGPLNASGDPRLQGLRVHLVTSGNEFYYAHLSRLAVKAGQKVKAGQIIGYSGAANGVQHLHFAQRSGNPLKLVA